MRDAAPPRHRTVDSESAAICSTRPLPKIGKAISHYRLLFTRGTRQRGKAQTSYWACRPWRAKLRRDRVSMEVYARLQQRGLCSRLRKRLMTSRWTGTPSASQTDRRDDSGFLHCRKKWDVQDFSPNGRAGLTRFSSLQRLNTVLGTSVGAAHDKRNSRNSGAWRSLVFQSLWACPGNAHAHRLRRRLRLHAPPPAPLRINNRRVRSPGPPAAVTFQK